MNADQLGTIFLLVAVAFMAYQGIRTQRPRDKAAPRASDRQEKASEELLFIAEATALLPDGIEAIQRLLERYTWQQILECTGVGTLHIELLRSIRSGREFDLLNPEASRPNEAEREAFREAKRAARTAAESFDRESWYQTPTTLTLKELVLGGFLESSPTVSSEDRTYIITIMPSGGRLLGLDKEFRNSTSRFEIPVRFFLSGEAQRNVSKLLRAAVSTDSARAA